MTAIPATAGSAEPLPDPSRSRAVLIGIARNPVLGDRPAIRENVKELKRLLVDSAVWGLAEKHVVCLEDEGADRRTILRSVRDLAREATEALLVYFAGHGLLEQPDQELHLATTAASRELMFEAVRYSDLRRELLSVACRASIKVLILDCCFSGKAAQALGDEDAGAVLAQQAEIDGTCVITACAATKLALAPSGELYTAFTGEIIEILNDGIPGEPGHLTAGMIYKRARARLWAKSRPLPEISGHNLGMMAPLVRNRAPVVVEAPPAAPTVASRRVPDGQRHATADAIAAARSRKDVVTAVVRAGARILDADVCMVCQRDEERQWHVASEFWRRDGYARTPRDGSYAMTEPNPQAAVAPERAWAEQLGWAIDDPSRSAVGDSGRTDLLRQRELAFAVIARVFMNGVVWGELIGARLPGSQPFDDAGVEDAAWLAAMFAFSFERAQHAETASEYERENRRLKQDADRMKLRLRLYGNWWPRAQDQDRPSAP